MREDRQKQTDANFCWMRSRLLASVDVIGLQTTEAYSNHQLEAVREQQESKRQETSQIGNCRFSSGEAMLIGIK
jgi:hypothetical protein